MAAKKTISKKDIALPLNYYEEEGLAENWADRLKLFALVYRNICAVRQKLLMKQPFIGNVLLNLGIVLDTTIDTAATDFRNIFVNPDFWVKLDDNERLFVLAHETWHVAMNHALRRQCRLPEPWNYATDLEIHFILQNEKFKEPWCLQHDPSWAPFSAERIYEEIVKNQPPQPPRGDPYGNGDPNGDGSQNGNQPGGGSCDEWGLTFPTGSDKSNDKFGSTNKPFDGVIYDDGKGGKDGKDDNGGGSGHGNDKKVIRKGEWKNASEEPEPIDEFVRRIVQQAVIVTQKQNGTIPGAVAGIIDEINNPVVPWQKQLDDWTTRVANEWGHNTYKRLNRRSWSCGVILPSTQNKSLKVAVALDTSGSCGPELQQFFGELNGIMGAFDEYELTVIQCDSRIQKVDKYTNEEPYDPNDGFKVRGFGGTDFRPVFDYIEENELHPTALIFLTDGYGPAPDEAPEYPVLWVITQGGERPCEWGEAVSLTNDRVE